MAENGYTSTSILSCLLPRELANTASRAGLMLPREKARKPERRHSNRHGCGGSLSPSATPLAEGLAGHYKPPMPTPTSKCPCPPPALASALRLHPHWPQETQALSKLSFPEQSPCFPNLPGNGKECSCFLSPPGLSLPTTVHSASYGWGGDWFMAKSGTQTPLICSVINGRSEKNKKLRPEEPIDL